MKLITHVFFSFSHEQTRANGEMNSKKKRLISVEIILEMMREYEIP